MILLTLRKRVISLPMERGVGIDDICSFTQEGVFEFEFEIDVAKVYTVLGEKMSYVPDTVKCSETRH
ncbi:hypothetical protein H8S90_11320 [Olivibacter sp. SDN3]|uniref:hypothetical protein n=1 Tax=Olivibacter sp. SDN3 TaxID=2764720 RepID=UPI0016516EF8|nr:hypothetical protein [Olivibacter sp. SDN3]QNL52110.1 hypothetical protein H8S90_11320 [Olivibacter sp. SDN3]